jgi:hypothetical protein
MGGISHRDKNVRGERYGGRGIWKVDRMWIYCGIGWGIGGSIGVEIEGG